MLHTLDALRRACNGAWAATPQPDRRIDELATDTRSLGRPEATLFAALTGPHRDGHRFLADAYARGVRAFLVARAPEPQLPPDAAVLQVPDVLGALQDIAATVRQAYAGPVVGITGSNGKTVVKEWLYAALSEDGPVLRSPKSYNSQLGVPLSVWGLDARYRVALFEAGISRPGEMARLQRVIRPTIGVFTNLGEAHREGFAGDAQKAAEKARLFTTADTLVYCADYPAVVGAVERLQAERALAGTAPMELVAWSQHGASAGWAVHVEAESAGSTRFRLENGAGLRQVVTIPFGDAAALENAVHCWLVLHLLGVPAETAARRLAQAQPVSMRLELRRGIHNCTLLDDAYNADLTSLRIALDTLQRQKQHPRHTVILSDLQQAGKPDAALYEEIARLLRDRGVQRFIGIGPALSSHRSAFKGRGLRSRFFRTTDAFLKAASTLAFEDEAILLKGARSFLFERIVAVLEAEVHRTVLSIDLSAMTANLAAYRSLLAPGTGVMAMVKAFSYGSGSYEIAAALQHAGIQYLAVAYPDEGIALRERGITLPIMVMSPDVASFDRMIAWRLEPEIFNFRSLAAFSAAAEALGVFGYPVHIKLDTGMHRLGFDAGALPQLIAALQRSGRVQVASIFSHLAAAEDPALDAFTAHQAALFEAGSAALMAALPEPPLRHLCNSAGIARHPGLHYDLVRLGLGLYGIDSSEVLRGRLQQVSRLRTTIAQLRELPAGEGVGYGHRDPAARPRRIATVCIGYADGYPRALGHGVAHMLVRGRPAPTVGSVCMDLCMLDVTGIPNAAEGDEVVVFGPELSLEQLAAWSGTIPYETMTGISQRVKRVYLNE